jgi:exodeoxyribonuclease VII large subunit
MENVGNTPEYTVSEIAGALKRTVEQAFGQVRVRGELSGFKKVASGHCYGALKDMDAVIDLVMFRGAASTLTFRPEDGLEVVVTGRLTTYPGRSKYQIIVERMAPAGVGALLAQIEARRLKLAGEGLFDAARKRPLPFLPKVIGIVTSPTGAVIRDILHRLADRFPRPVLVWPVLVQGEGAAAQVAAAIRGFNALAPGGTDATTAERPVPRPDLIIVARGGGSIEDLMAFNEEIVVRAAAESAIPLISAVGHETDTTLIDYAADWRAPTPTAAAERAVPVRADLAAQLAVLGGRLASAQVRGLAQRRERAAALAARLPAPRRLLELPMQRIDDLSGRLPRALGGAVARSGRRLAQAGAALRPALLAGRRERAASALAQAGRGLERGMAARLAVAQAGLDSRAAGLRPWLLRHRQEAATARLASAARLLGSLGPQQVLARGYALVLGADGQPVTKTAEAAAQPRLTIRLADGDTRVVPEPAQARLL